MDIIEKPKSHETNRYYDAAGVLRVSMNIFKFNGEMIYPYLKNCPVNHERNEKELPTAILSMIKDYPNAMVGLPFSEHVPDLTAKEDIAIMKEYLKKNHITLTW